MFFVSSFIIFFFFKQKTAYEMRISDWSSDVCSSDLGLYVEEPEAVEITDGVLYRARIAIPARVPVGRFTAETFLIQNGRVLAAAVREIDIRKSGFERFVVSAAENASILYGLTAVVLSVAPGWFAGWVGRRVWVPTLSGLPGAS